MASKDGAHDYQDCDDPYCMMFGCRAYKAGKADGWDIGWLVGYADGMAACMGQGGGSS